MNRLEKLVVIDVGNGVTCYKAGNGAVGSFPSVTMAYSDLPANAQQFAKPLKTSSGSYIVGEEAKSLNVNSRSTDTSYYSSDEYRICLLYAMSKIGIKNPILGLGLPTEWFDKFRDELQVNAKRWLNEEGYHVEKIVILPQHMGPYFDPSLVDIDGNPVLMSRLRQGRVGVIDIGQGTTDLGEFENGKPTLKTFGESYGISDVHKEVFTILGNPDVLSDLGRKARAMLPKEFKLDRNSTERTIDSWFRQGYIPYKGNKIDIFEVSQFSREDFSKKYILRAITKMWGNTDFLSGVILAGGGVEVIGLSIMGKLIDCPVYKSLDPSMSIVNGFFEAIKGKLKIAQ